MAEALLIAVPLGVAGGVAVGETEGEAFGLPVLDGLAVGDGALKQMEGCGVSRV